MSQIEKKIQDILIDLTGRQDLILTRLTTQNVKKFQKFNLFHEVGFYISSRPWDETHEFFSNAIHIGYKKINLATTLLHFRWLRHAIKQKFQRSESK